MGLTKEQIEAIKANPELKELYDSLNKDYTTKTQEIAAIRNIMEELQFNSPDDLKSYIESWQQYGQGVEPIMAKIRDSGVDVSNFNWDTLKEMASNDNDDDDRRQSSRSKSKGGAMIEGEFYTKKEINNMVKGFQKNLDDHYNERFSSYDRVIDQALELQDLYRDHYTRTGKFDMDPKKVFDVALAKKLRSLRDAYRDPDAYGSDISKEEVDREVTKRLEERDKADSGKGGFGDSHEAPVAPKFPGNVEHQHRGFKSRINEVLSDFKSGALSKDTTSTPINSGEIGK